MKSTGIVRRIDDLGRVVIPKELRRTLGVNNGDSLEIYVEGDIILLKKYVDEAACVICHEYRDDLIQLDSAKICRPCAQVITKVMKQ